MSGVLGVSLIQTSPWRSSVTERTGGSGVAMSWWYPGITKLRHGNGETRFSGLGVSELESGCTIGISEGGRLKHFDQVSKDH